MLRLFKRSSRPIGSDRSSALDRLLSLWLALAREERATAIIIGMPREMPPSIGPENAAEFRHELCSDERMPREDSDVHRALAMSSRFKSAAGWRSVPVWMRVDGVLYAVKGIPIGVHFAVFPLLEDRLRSLDASEENPRPMRFIEYDSQTPSERRFAELELWVDEDNTTRIEIVRHLCQPASVNAVPSVY